MWFIFLHLTEATIVWRISIWWFSIFYSFLRSLIYLRSTFLCLLSIPILPDFWILASALNHPATSKNCSLTLLHTLWSQVLYENIIILVVELIVVEELLIVFPSFLMVVVVFVFAWLESGGVSFIQGRRKFICLIFRNPKARIGKICRADGAICSNSPKFLHWACLVFYFLPFLFLFLIVFSPISIRFCIIAYDSFSFIWKYL
jgi:hypothetical protein